MVHCSSETLRHHVPRAKTDSGWTLANVLDGLGHSLKFGQEVRWKWRFLEHKPCYSRSAGMAR